MDVESNGLDLRQEIVRASRYSFCLVYDGGCRLKILNKIFCALFLMAMSVAAQAEELVVAYTKSSVPFSFKNDQGVRVGFNVDMGHAICDAMKVQCVYKAMDFSEMLPAVSKGQVDIALPNMLKTPMRAKKVAFTIPYWRSTSIFMGPVDYPFEKRESAVEKSTVCAISNTRQYEYLKKYKGAAASEIIETTTTQDTLDKMQTGECTLVLLPTLQSVAFLESEDGFGYGFLGTPISKNGLGGNVHIIVRPKHSGLLERVDHALETLIKDGTHERITRKYFPLSIL